MKTIVCMGFALSCLLSADVRGQSQQEMNQQAYASFEKADKELNQVYAKVQARLDEQGRAKLKAAQRAWVAFRDAQADLDADFMRGGSAAPMLHSGSLAETTKKRIADLKEFLKQLEDT